MDFAGPEALTLREMAEQLTAAREVDRRIHELPLPGRVERALTTGNTSASGHRGTTTWAEWLARGSGPSRRPDRRVVPASEERGRPGIAGTRGN